ncbi:hypothetical protein ACOU7P_002788, partial [Enterococcus hirae]
AYFLSRRNHLSFHVLVEHKQLLLTTNSLPLHQIYWQLTKEYAMNEKKLCANIAPKIVSETDKKCYRNYVLSITSICQMKKISTA